tara:strand:+ start:5446 stop:6120 length:675 start_codon:yes stop_codon:yes gene_type:complete
MTYEEIKALAKQHFNLVEVKAENSEVAEQFATATLEDGTKVTNDKDSKFAVGDKIFVEVDGEKKDAPEGDHITESGMTITLDAASIITGMKRPDEAGEGSEGLAEDAPVEEEMSAETATKEPIINKEAFEEEVIIEEKMELEDVIKVIGEVVEEKIDIIGDRMTSIEEKMKAMEEKMSAFASEPAEPSVVTSNFSKKKAIKEIPALQDKRYFKMLEKLQTINKI